jgi:uncharacterized protein
MAEQDMYLDSSALVKRYIKEPGTKDVDEIFDKMDSGNARLYLSIWNTGEVAGVIDRYDRKGAVNYQKCISAFFNDLERYLKSDKLEIINITPSLISASIEILRKYHIYLADALQIETCKVIGADLFVTGDKELYSTALKEGLNAKYIS